MDGNFMIREREATGRGEEALREEEDPLWKQNMAFGV